MLIDLQNFFTDLKSDTFSTKQYITYPPHLKYVAALPQETWH